MVSVTENCPGTVSVPDFKISSPMSGHGGRMSCAWNLTTHIGTQITLEFTEFYISNNDNNQPCNSNYVQVSDGTSSIKFCHSSNVPKEFLSEGNFVSIKFYSRQFRDWRKFSVKYKAVTNGKYCPIMCKRYDIPKSDKPLFSNNKTAVKYLGIY